MSDFGKEIGVNERMPTLSGLPHYLLLASLKSQHADKAAFCLKRGSADTFARIKAEFSVYLIILYFPAFEKRKKGKGIYQFLLEKRERVKEKKSKMNILRAELAFFVRKQKGEAKKSKEIAFLENGTKKTKKDLQVFLYKN